MELKGSRTEENLRTAFAGESQAHTKYLYYASKASKDGYVQIGKMFEETARNEKEHAKIWFKLLHDGGVPSTEENLADAAADMSFDGNIYTVEGEAVMGKQQHAEFYVDEDALFELVLDIFYIPVKE